MVIGAQSMKQLVRIFGPKLIRIESLIKTVRGAVSNDDFFLRRQPRNFSNVTIVARRRKHFGGFLAIFWLLNSLQKEVF